MKERIIKFFKEAFSIEDNRASKEEIKNTFVAGAKLKGPNMCILVLAIIIACVGLNMNSTAVVIGAMLISPLMGCILGIGYGLATNDLKFAKRSFIGLIIEVIICMLTSTLYFLISPIETASHELLARTSPTIWDVIIAIAGGLAGSIGLTRKEKSNVIPGVAIATAIIPPLCTAGFGLATWQLRYFLGALYLFFINAFFICIAAVFVLRTMKMPKKRGVDKKEERKIHRNMVLIAVITVIPSIILAYQIVYESVLQNNIQKYIANEFQYEGTQVISSSINLEKKQIDLALVGKILNADEILKLTTNLKQYGIENMSLKITQTEIEEGISQEEIEALIQKEISKQTTSTLTSSSSKKDGKTTGKTAEMLLDIKEEANDVTERVKEEIKEKYNQIETCTITRSKTINQTETTKENTMIVTITLKEEITENEEQEIEKELKEKLGDSIVIHKEMKEE